VTHVDEVKEAYDIARKTLVNFRTIFMPTDNEIDPAPFHYRWSDLLLNGKQNIAVEGYRESSKTTYVIRSHILYRLMFPSKEYDYVVFIKATQETADSMLDEISTLYITNPAMCANLVKINEKKLGCFDVVVRDVSGEEINVRIEAFGKGSSSIRGLIYGDKRPKLCVCDDLQTLKDMESETMLAKDWKWFLSDVWFLGRTCRIFLIGNNLGQKCIIEQCIANKDDLDFDVEVVPVADEYGNPTWPSRNTVEQIEKEKASFQNLGELDVWLREKMCQSINPETQQFKKEYFKYTDVEPKGLVKVVLCDPAISKSDKACYTAVIVWGVNPDNHWFLCDIDYGHFDPGETVESIFRMVSKHKPMVVGVEDVGYQKALQWIINQEMPRRNIFFRCEPLKHGGRAKEIRIQGLQPRYKAGTVWHLSGLHGLAEYESELLCFKPGVTSRVDLIDAAAYGDQLIIPPTKRVIDRNRPAPKRGAL
jgi:hypothetical protein